MVFNMSYGKLCVQRKNCSEIIMLELFFKEKIMLELSPSLFTSNNQDVGCFFIKGRVCSIPKI